MAKAKAAAAPTSDVSFIYVTRGVYAGQVMQVEPDLAAVANGDQWGVPYDNLGPTGFDSNLIPDGWSTSPYGLPQSLVDFETAGQPDDSGPPEPPEPVPAPVLSSLSPDTAELGSEDVTMSAIGENFTAETRIVFAGNQENTVFVSDTEVTTIVKPTLGWGAVSVPVYVKTGEEQSESLDFTFTEPEEEA